jgi:hemerythrin-like domain-containing protein
MDPTRCLRDEHQVILDVLACFETALQRARESGAIRADEVLAFVEFFRGYADQCHHGKEEDSLFPALAGHGFPPDSGPVQQMLEEHRIGRAHVAAIAGVAERGDADAVQTILSEGEAYIDLLRSHIDKENNVLFEIAGQVIQGEDADILIGQYNELESDVEYVQTLSRCRAIAQRLIEAYG